MGPAQTSTVTIGGPGVGNVISANVVGITLTGGDALVQGNLVDTDATGTTALPNGTGIDVVPGGRATIGGTAPGARNVVSGNNGAGISISSSLNPGPTILGNFIGTDAGGSAALGNTAAGILVTGAGTGHATIGAPGAGNVISANQPASTSSRAPPATSSPAT